MRHPLTSILLATSVAVALVGCGKTPTAPKMKASRATLQRTLPAGQVPALGQQLPGTADPRVGQLLAGVAQLQANGQTADTLVKVIYNLDDGSVRQVRSRYKYQKPSKNFLEILSANEPKVVGTKVAWSGSGGGVKANVRTKFIGFWLTVSLDLHDERLRDKRGNFLDETSLDRSLATILDPGAQVAFKGEGELNGKRMAVIDVVSPLKLKNVTRDTFGIDLQTFQPILREMYKGEKLIYKMTIESAKLNPSLSSKDFAVD
jgi:hypothetical protein